MTDLITTARNLPAMVAVLERGHAALAEANTNLERERIRGEAATIEAYAKEVVKRRDLQTLASVLVMDAERVLAKKNPPLPPTEYGAMKGKKGIEDSKPFSSAELASMRHVHTTGNASLDDTAYAQARADP